MLASRQSTWKLITWTKYHEANKHNKVGLQKSEQVIHIISETTKANNGTKIGTSDPHHILNS